MRIQRKFGTWMLWGLALLALALMLAFLGPAVARADEAVTASPTPEITPTPTPELTPTPTPEITPTPTPELTPTPTPEITPTPTPELTASPTPEITSTPTLELTPTPTQEITPTSTPAPTPTPTPTPSPTPESTQTTTPTPSPTPESTQTTTPTSSSTPESTPTPTPSPTPDPTPTSAPTDNLSVLFEMDGDVLKAYLAKGENKRVEIPEGVRIIGKDAFRGDTKLEYVILPDSVEEIQETAFADCASLKEVIVTSDTRLSIIGAKAFLNCEKINQTFAENAETVANDSFEGVPVVTAVPTVTPAPTETPEPTEEPEPEATADPYEEIEWEEPVTVSTGSSSGKRRTHGKAKTTETHDYDQVNVKLDPGSESQPMHVLTLDGEELELSLNGEDGEARQFTVSLLDRAGESGDGEALILRAAESETEETEAAPEALRWQINGAALRKLNKSGIERLIFLRGDQAVSVPTEGFLAGWTYDELKSRGTAGRRFDYALTMDDPAEPFRWSVTVEETTWELGEDPLAPMYLTGVETGIVEIMREEEAK